MLSFSYEISTTKIKEKGLQFFPSFGSHSLSFSDWRCSLYFAFRLKVNLSSCAVVSEGESPGRALSSELCRFLVSRSDFCSIKYRRMECYEWNVIRADSEASPEEDGLTIQQVCFLHQGK